MNNWMRYCQKKGFCPECAKSLCVCSKAIDKRTADHMFYQEGLEPDSDAYDNNAEPLRYNSGDEIEHTQHPGLMGTVVGPAERREHYIVHFPGQINQMRTLHSDYLMPADQRIRRSTYPPNEQHPEREGRESTGEYQEGYMGTAENYHDKSYVPEPTRRFKVGGSYRVHAPPDVYRHNSDLSGSHGRRFIIDEPGDRGSGGYFADTGERSFFSNQNLVPEDLAGE